MKQRDILSQHRQVSKRRQTLCLISAQIKNGADTFARVNGRIEKPEAADLNQCGQGRRGMRRDMAQRARKDRYIVSYQDRTQ